MGLGDSIRKFIKDNITNQLDETRNNVKKLSGAMRKGGANNQANEADKLLKKIDTIKNTKNQLINLKKQVDGFLSRAEAAKKAAEKLREANTVASALNPAAAAITLVQEKLITKAQDEIKDLGSAVDIVDPTVQEIDVATADMESELNQAKKDQEDMEENKKNRDEMLGRG